MKRVLALTVLYLGCVLSVTFAQSVDFDALQADEEFGFGVRAYHEGYFEDAVQSFLRALSLRPTDDRTREWLGNAYYRIGLEQAALSEWIDVASRGNASEYLQSRIERLRLDTGTAPDAVAREPYVYSRNIEGMRGGLSVFRRPSSIYPLPTGGYLVVSFSSHEIIVLDVNGNRLGRWAGGVLGFDAPFGLTSSGGQYFLTEFGADSVSVLNNAGARVARFGGSGSGEGELLGPQYIAADGQGYLYVSDWGNRRVVKFDESGEYILSFGRRTAGFDGLQSVTGLLYYDNRVFVGDEAGNGVRVFDESGNYLETLGSGRLGRVEGLSLYGPGEILISAGSELQVLDVDMDTLRRLSDFQGGAARIVHAIRDANGEIVAADFDRSQLHVLTERPGLYTGLRVSVERIDTRDWPVTLVDLRVENRSGDPVVGLRAANFIPTEGGVAVDGKQLVYVADRNMHPHVSLLVSGALPGSSGHDLVEDIARGVHQTVPAAGSLRLVSGGTEPYVVTGPGTGVETFVANAAGHTVSGNTDRFDLAVRLAAGELLRSRGPRSVAFVSSGRLGSQAFTDYEIDDLAAYLRNNGIRFDLLVTGSAGIDPDLDYLVSETGGGIFRPQDALGMLPYQRAIASRTTGRYTLWYRSNRFGDFGRALIPVEVEVVLGRMTGRGESAYFSPLEF
ncbi:MAG: hypothetical protein EA383_03185 [Spirochaetaceae bacterium]|nr:MAG: hypothetical protein EA383_03185 [Spirochaetaceae bacterium]